MIRLLQRTETEKSNIRILWQKADIGRKTASFLEYPWTATSEYTCYFCRYNHRFLNNSDQVDCSKQHSCERTRYPIICMANTISIDTDGEWTNPDGTDLTYQRTGIYRQFQFESMPHHVQLFLCNNGQARCNAHCFYHAWRLANKRTWRQCGATHLCQNDGSMWQLMAPVNSELYEEFLQQL